MSLRSSNARTKGCDFPFVKRQTKSEAEPDSAFSSLVSDSLSDPPEFEVSLDFERRDSYVIPGETLLSEEY